MTEGRRPVAGDSALAESIRLQRDAQSRITPLRQRQRQRARRKVARWLLRLLLLTILFAAVAVVALDLYGVRTSAGRLVDELVVTSREPT